MLTREVLVGVMPGAAGMADRVVPVLDAAMQRFDIASPARMAAFLAQPTHESGELRHCTGKPQSRAAGPAQDVPEVLSDRCRRPGMRAKARAHRQPRLRRSRGGRARAASGCWRRARPALELQVGTMLLPSARWLQ